MQVGGCSAHSAAANGEAAEVFSHLPHTLCTTRGVAVSDRPTVIYTALPLFPPLILPHTSGTTSVFAGSDRPTVIYANNHKLAFSTLNESEVRGCHPSTLSNPAL